MMYFINIYTAFADFFYHNQSQCKNQCSYSKITSYPALTMNWNIPDVNLQETVYHVNCNL